MKIYKERAKTGILANEEAKKRKNCASIMKGRRKLIKE